ncbi:unnamed protein product, partial [Rotaria magnacalcarata]
IKYFKTTIILLPMDDTFTDNAFSLKNNEFYTFIEELVGQQIVDILKFQSIASTQSLIRNPNIFEIFNMKCTEPNFLSIREKSCFQFDNGQFIVKIGVMNNLNYLLDFLKQQQQKKIMENSYVDSNVSLSFDFIDKHPLLKALILWYQQVDNVDINNKDKHGFLKDFIDTITNNLTKSSSRFRYSDTIKNFALSLYILGGKLTYEFIRLNLPGSLPSLTMLNTLISNSNSKISEAEFRFDQLQQHFDDLNFQYAFGSEDATSIIKKIKYDSTTNTFNGFPTPLDRGVPIKEYYQTDSFDKLKLWFNSNDKSSLLNVHMIQPVQSTNQSIIPSPFLLSAYGIDNTATANDILQRWWYIFNQCLQRNIRIIGFSTDATHLVTKWRNRLLSSTAELRLGNQSISITHLHDIIENETYTKLDHGLTKSDINPKDLQNFSSCLKLTSTDVFKILNDNISTRGTLIYLQMLKMIVVAYIEKKTTIAERLRSAWCVVFFCRIWLTWTKFKTFNSTQTTGKNKSRYFITRPAYLSVEINAHNLLYLILLVQQKQLPPQVLHIHTFSSQACESIFRNTRALSGIYSTIVNFTVHDFLRRAQRLSLLNDIKCKQLNDESINNLVFPVHCKHRHDRQSLFTQSQSDIDQIDIEQVITDAYHEAIDMLDGLEILNLLKDKRVLGLNLLSEYVFKQLNSNSKMHDYSSQLTNIDDEEFELADDDDDETTNDLNMDDDNNDDFPSNDDYSDEDEQDDARNLIDTRKEDFVGMKVLNTIQSHIEHSYFKVKINDDTKYMHKQTGCWLLTGEKREKSRGKQQNPVHWIQVDSSGFKSAAVLLSSSLSPSTTNNQQPLTTSDNVLQKIASPNSILIIPPS